MLECQKRAIAKYQTEKVKTVTAKFYPRDAELVAWMERNGYRGAWLANLARAEYERSNADK